MKKKNSYQTFLEMLDEVSTENIIKEPSIDIASDLLSDLSIRLDIKSGGEYVNDSPEYDLLMLIKLADSNLYDSQKPNTLIDIDRLVLSFFKLGCSLGRHQGLQTLSSIVKESAEYKTKKSNGGRKSPYYEFNKVIMAEIAKHEAIPKQKHQITISKLKLIEKLFHPPIMNG
jgi:hypothetical protein